MLINEHGAVYTLHRDDPDLLAMFKHLVVSEGYNPVGPRCQALAERFREEARAKAACSDPHAAS